MRRMTVIEIVVIVAISIFAIFSLLRLFGVKIEKVLFGVPKKKEKKPKKAKAMKAKKQKVKKLYESIRECLDEREKMIIELRYGLKDGKQIPQRKIAKILNISRSYVSRIEKKAVEKLKDALINME